MIDVTALTAIATEAIKTHRASDGHDPEFGALLRALCHVLNVAYGGSAWGQTFTRVREYVTLVAGTTSPAPISGPMLAGALLTLAHPDHTDASYSRNDAGRIIRDDTGHEVTSTAKDWLVACGYVHAVAAPTVARFARSL